MIINIEMWLDELRTLRGQFESGCKENNQRAIERSLYYSALVIRKFSETPFVNRTFLSPCIDVDTFKPAKGAIDALNWLDPESHFNLKKREAGKASLVDICNTLIHSRFLSWRPGEGAVEQIIVSGGMRGGLEAIGFSPKQYSKLLDQVANYKFKSLPMRSVRRTA